jgi:hypothetical protein
MNMSRYRLHRRTFLAATGATLASATLPIGSAFAAKKYASRSKSAPGRVIPYSSVPEPWSPYFNPVGAPRSESHLRLSPAFGNGIEE